jgi:hypothetical protein
MRDRALRRIGFILPNDAEGLPPAIVSDDRHPAPKTDTAVRLRRLNDLRRGATIIPMGWARRWSCPSHSTGGRDRPRDCRRGVSDPHPIGFNRTVLTSWLLAEPPDDLGIRVCIPISDRPLRIDRSRTPFAYEGLLAPPLVLKAAIPLSANASHSALTALRPCRSFSRAGSLLESRYYVAENLRSKYGGHSDQTASTVA